MNAVLAIRYNFFRQAPGGHNVTFFAELRFHSFDHAVNHAGCSENDSGAHTVNRIVADRMFRRFQADARELRRAVGQRVH